MAGIEKVIDDLICYVFDATMDQVMTELFHLGSDEWEADFAVRMEYSEGFMQSSQLKDLEVAKFEKEYGSYLITHSGSGRSILLSNPLAMETDLLSDKFPLLFEAVKSRDASKTLYEAIECIISDVELSPLVPALRKQVVAAGIKPEVWDKFIAHLIENKNLCHKENKKQLCDLYKDLNKTEAELPLSKTILKKEHRLIKDEFIALMHQLSDKIVDLKTRGEVKGAVAAASLKTELVGLWQRYLMKQDVNAFKQACEESIRKHEPELNASRGGQWKQWFADLGYWLLRLISCGCAVIEEGDKKFSTKITTDTMRIAMDLEDNVSRLALYENRFFIPALNQTLEERVEHEESIELK